MKKSITHGIRYVLLAMLAVIVTPLVAQVAVTSPDNQTTSDVGAKVVPTLSPPGDTASDEIVRLDPFTVTSLQEGYKAEDTLGGARVRTKLADTPSAISVITPKFMQDLGVNNAQDLLIYTTNTEVAGLNGNYSGVSSRGFGVANAGESTRLVNPAGVNRARGLTAMDNTRNYFQSQIPWDGYNISRVDISRGPNSFLFGSGSPSGISNVSTNEATYKTGGNVEVHVGSYGTSRESFDYNQVLLKQQLAVRLNLVNDDTKYQQDPAYNHTKRVYAAMRFDPKILDTKWAHTKIQANYEHGKGDSNNPRELPPLDYISSYFKQGVNKAGYDPFVYNNIYNSADVNSDIRNSPWVTNSDIHYLWGNAAAYWWDASSGQLMRMAQGGAGSAVSSNQPDGLRNNQPDTSQGFPGQAYHVYSTGFSQYARVMDYNYIQANGAGNPGGSPFPGAYKGTVNYIDKTLTDTSTFDFYNHLIDGTSKREWQDWDAFNISVVQSLFNDKLTIQAVYDYQKYENGQEGLMVGNVSPYISVDLDSYLVTYPSWNQGAQANPNVGRPFIANDTGSGNSSNKYINNNYQLTASYSLDFREIVHDKGLASILGHHEFTGLAGRYSIKQDYRAWQLYAMDSNYATAAGLTDDTLASRNISWVSYLGPSLKNATTASGAHLSALPNAMIPMSGNINVWNNTWTASSVNPADPWNNVRPDGTVTTTQLDNPANYAGYTPLYGNVLNTKSNKDQLYTHGNKSEQVTKSYAFMYQGFFWDDAIIPQFGWRRDEVTQRGNQAPVDSLTGIASMNYALTDSGVTQSTNSKSYGIALHLPKSLKQMLPEGTDISLFYFHGSNETPKVRYAIDGSLLPNETGKTDDYGVQLDAFKGRATLRLTIFKTKDNNAQASYGQPLGNAGWLIDSLPSWTLTMAAAGIAASKLPTGTAPAGMEGGDWFWSWGQTNPTLAQNIATAIQKNYPVMFPQSFWDQYGMPVDMSKVTAGDWMHILSNGTVPYTWNITNSHTIHGTTPIIDQNILSKGFELEATVRPMKNWDITFNASKVTAYQTSLGAAADRYLNDMYALWGDPSNPIGDTPEWGGTPIRQEFMKNIWGPYLTQKALTGTDQPELRKWNFKIITNYTVDRGILKNLNIGGAWRWMSKPILGYGISETMLAAEPAMLADINKPIYGTSDSHFDLWIGYQFKLTKKVDCRLQLNIRNVGEKSGLIPVSVEPDGSVAQSRITQGQTIDFSTKVMF